VLLVILLACAMPGLALDWNATDYPIVNEDYTMTIMISRNTAIHPEEMETIQCFSDYAQKSGVNVVFDEVSSTDVAQRLNILLAAGDYPDAFIKCPMTPDILLRYGSEGTFVDVGPLLEDYAPNFLAAIENLPQVKTAITQSDGAIYGFPYVCGIMDVRAMKMYINRVFMNNLGIADMPETTEEFKNLMLAFKEGDANGNGDPNDEVPLSVMPISIHSFIRLRALSAFTTAVYWQAMIRTR